MPSEATNRVDRVDARLLRERKRKAQEKNVYHKNISQDNEEWIEKYDDDIEESWDMGAEIDIIRKEYSKTEMVKKGIQLGKYLRKRIDETRFDGGSFFAVLILSLIKDFSDVITFGVSSFVTTFVITPALIIIFLMRKGNIFKRYLKKKLIFAPIIKLIPFINIYPAYTILTLNLKLKMNKKVRKLKEDIDTLDREMKKI